jgi:hypothetical protein
MTHTKQLIFLLWAEGVTGCRISKSLISHIEGADDKLGQTLWQHSKQEKN